MYNLEAAIRYNREGAEASYKVGDPEIIRNAEINLGDDYLLWATWSRPSAIWRKSTGIPSSAGSGAKSG